MRSVPMSEATPGPFRIDSVMLPSAQASRLSELGLRRGLPISVLHSRGDGGVVVVCGDTRLAVDAATASRVWLVAFGETHANEGNPP